MRVYFPFALITAFGGILFLAGCSACSTNQPQNPDQLRQQTANATSAFKNDAKAVAEGIRDGLRRPSSDEPLDLNTASEAQLKSLPGISGDTAARIAANRLYKSTHDLIDRRLVTPAEYSQIASRITVK
jgi:DNA uptake protein ComE-like DNA-binding protein